MRSANRVSVEGGEKPCTCCIGTRQSTYNQQTYTNMNTQSLVSVCYLHSKWIYLQKGSAQAEREGRRRENMKRYEEEEEMEVEEEEEKRQVKKYSVLERL